MTGCLRHRRGLWRAWTARLALMPLLAIWAVTQAGGQESNLPGEGASAGVPASNVRDGAGLFGGSAIDAARNELRRIERETKIATMIETVDTLRGESIDSAAARLARLSGIKGIYTLIARRENKIEVLVSRDYQRALARPR